MQTGAISCVINYSKIEEKYFLTIGCITTKFWALLDDLGLIRFA
jgi:hypothetical protein